MAQNFSELASLWLGEEISKVDKVAMSLQAAGATGRAAGTACMLVAGFAVPMMNSYVVAADAAGRYLGAVGGGANRCFGVQW